MNKHALIIGIDYVGANHLPGTLASANGLAKLLRLSHGFSVVELLSANATRTNIVAKLLDLWAATPGQGDIALAYYCGHGSRVSIQGNVTDCLVPWDALTDPANLIIADQVHALLAKRAAHSHVLAALDCCYAGGEMAHQATLPTHAAKGIPWFVAGVAPIEGMETLSVASTPAPHMLTSSASNLIQWAPCGPTQVSVEQEFAGEWYSLFTYELLRAMQDGQPHTYSSMFATVKAKCIQAYPSAIPEMIGDAALEAKAFLS